MRQNLGETASSFIKTENLNHSILGTHFGLLKISSSSFHLVIITESVGWKGPLEVI